MTTSTIDLDFLQELVINGASKDALDRLTNDEKAAYVKLKRENDMASKKKVAKKVAKKVTAKVEKVKGPSKMDLAVEIYAKNPDATRQELLLMFMTDAKLTKAGANTYLANIRKKIKEESEK